MKLDPAFNVASNATGRRKAEWRNRRAWQATLGCLFLAGARALSPLVAAVPAPGLPRPADERQLAPPATWQQTPAAAPRRRQLLSATSAGLAGTAIRPVLAEESPKLTAAWTAKDGVQFLTYFNEENYGAMRDDTRRTPQFIKAIQQRVTKRPGITLLDIGTGPFALFALVAIRAGAKKVYAVEANPEAAERAKQFVSEQEDIPEGAVEVIEGFTTGLTLPEKVDVVVAEIVGAFASEENMIETIRDAQERHMKNPRDPENYIPFSVQTFTAPVSYALHPILAPPRYEKLGGQPLRLNPRDQTMQLIADPQKLEDIVFSDPNLPKAGRWAQPPLSFSITSLRLEANYKKYLQALTGEEKVPTEEADPLARKTADTFSGMAFWPRLVLDPAGEIIVESRGPLGEHQKSHWPTVMALMSPTPVPVAAGDVIKISEAADFARDIMGPAKYTLDGQLIRGGKSA
eukprot:TRINITY_DN24936_c0_g1_i1.p1 TRINITY_DN24936_c0_g1~~TRINITY_DN24936_c0_g1_i1.p1  ORF type:complete len:460 (-),score=92.76 TRINITY_DN24936_c0_g1_i1:47-1426(-)